MGFIVFLCALLLSTNSFASEYVIKYKNRSFLNYNLKGEHSLANLALVDLTDKELASVKSDSNIEYIVPNFKLHSLLVPTDDLKPQWSLAKIKTQEAWSLAGNKGSREVLMSIIDTGIDYNHSSLQGNIAAGGFDFFDNDDDPMDEIGANPGHGTHCAGILGANGDHISGMMQTTSILPIRFLGADGSGDLLAGIKSIDYAIEKKVKVISASWGANTSEESAKPLIEAIKRADDAGIVFVSAASNDGADNDASDVYPANAGLPNTITVAASDDSDGKPSWSNYGRKKVHIAAPGEAIISSLPDNKYGELSGTSMATPLVAGLVGFLLSQDETLTGAEIRAVLQKTGDQIDIINACNCRINAVAATKAVLNKDEWLVPSAASLNKNETLQLKLKNAKNKPVFSVSDSSLATITDDGLLTAVGLGNVVVTAKDGEKVIDSLPIYVGVDLQCPFVAPVCSIICKVNPSKPWCEIKKYNFMEDL